MTALRRQFFLSFAAIGSVMPLVTVFCVNRAASTISRSDLAMSLMGVPTLCSPALITLLADRKLRHAGILAVAYTCSAVVLALALFLAEHRPSPGALLFPTVSPRSRCSRCRTGIIFRSRKNCAAPEERSSNTDGADLGTTGYIVPSLVLYYPLPPHGAEVRSILPCAMVFCFLSLANSFTLQPVARRERLATARSSLGARPSPPSSPRRRDGYASGCSSPTLAAATYYAFIGNYLDEVVGIPKPYIALVIMLGVLVEVGCTLIMPWLQRHLRLKGSWSWGSPAWSCA